MLVNINQKDKRLLPDIRDYGCLFLCFAQQSSIIFKGDNGCTTLNNIWKQAIEERIISRDCVIQEHTTLANKFFLLNVKYDEMHHDADEPIPDDVAFVFGRFVWKYGHFVIIDKNKNVTFDSLVDSYSVKNGELQSMRFYYAI